MAFCLLDEQPHEKKQEIPSKNVRKTREPNPKKVKRKNTFMCIYPPDIERDTERSHFSKSSMYAIIKLFNKQQKITDINRKEINERPYYVGSAFFHFKW